MLAATSRRKVAALALLAVFALLRLSGSLAARSPASPLAPPALREATIAIATGVTGLGSRCFNSLAFSSSDLDVGAPSKLLRACDFNLDGALVENGDGGTSVHLGVACHSEDAVAPGSPEAELLCQAICLSVNDCETWDVDESTATCNVYHQCPGRVQVEPLQRRLQGGATSASPTTAPTDAPSANPTSAPTDAPSANPTSAPTDAPSANPTFAPSASPTAAPTLAPTSAPTAAPTSAPTAAPTSAPTAAPTQYPTWSPTLVVGIDPSLVPLDGVSEKTGLLQTDFYQGGSFRTGVVANSNKVMPNNTQLGIFYLTYSNFDTRRVFHLSKEGFAAEMQAAAVRHSKGRFRWSGNDGPDPRILLVDPGYKTRSGTRATRSLASAILRKRFGMADDSIKVISHNFGLPNWPGSKKSDYSNAGGSTAHLKKTSPHLHHHEVGHLCGLGHQNKFEVVQGEADEVNKYAGTTSHMSDGDPTGDYPYSVAGLHRIGWVPDDIIYVEPGKEVTLRSLDHPEEDHPVGLVWLDSYEGTHHFFGYYPGISSEMVMLGTPMENGYGFVEEIAPFSSPLASPDHIQIGTYGRDFVNQQGLRFTVHRFDDKSVTLTVSLEFEQRIQRGLQVNVNRKFLKKGGRKQKAKIRLDILLSNRNPNSQKNKMVHHPVSIAGKAFVLFNGRTLQLTRKDEKSDEKLDGTGLLHFKRRSGRRVFVVYIERPDFGKVSKTESFPATLFVGKMSMPLTLRFAKTPKIES